MKYIIKALNKHFSDEFTKYALGKLPNPDLIRVLEIKRRKARPYLEWLFHINYQRLSDADFPLDICGKELRDKALAANMLYLAIGADNYPLAAKLAPLAAPFEHDGIVIDCRDIRINIISIAIARKKISEIVKILDLMA
jgi:hypothetical protein